MNAHQTSPTTPDEPRPCLAVGALVVDGVRKAWIRCGERAGHDEPLAVIRGYVLPELTLRVSAVGPGDEILRRLPRPPHRAVLEWLDDEAMRDEWPEAYDPAEGVDVDVAPLSDDELEAIAEAARVDALIDAGREAAAWPDSE
jgi:hypothetical protein